METENVDPVQLDLPFVADTEIIIYARKLDELENNCRILIMKNTNVITSDYEIV